MWILSEENSSYSADLYVKKCRQVDILPLSLKFDLNDLLFLHKVINCLIPVSLPDYLTFYQGGSRLRRSHLDNYSLVSSILPRFNCQNRSYEQDVNSRNPFSKSFFYRTHLLWNTLPLDLRKISCPGSFKTEVIQHLWKSVLEEEHSLSFSNDNSI